jgi:tetratricopeptide (TPR) repeat protein
MLVYVFALALGTPTGLPPLLAQDLQQLAGQYAARSERQYAESLYKRALQITQEVLGASHPAVAQILLQLGDLYAHLALHALAAQHYQQALAVLARDAASSPGLREEIDARLALLPVTGDDRP